MSTAALVQFDDPPRGAPQGAQPATERIAATLRSAGIDAPNSLYDEALAFARDGHLGQAHARLQMLVCLDPDDAEALLLMAKVHAAQGRPAEALARLDGAVAAGGLAPAGFRDQLEGAIRAERAREEEHRARIAAREQGEIRSLRNETRTLRSETVRLETEVIQAQERERTWKYAALGVSVVGTLVIGLLALFGGPSSGDDVAAAPAAAVAAVDGAVVAPPADGAPTIDGAAAPAAVPSGSLPTAKVEKPPAAVVAPKPDAPKAEAPKADAKADAKGGARVHVVAKGDTLYKLAARYYGDSSRWEDIQKANKATLKKGIDLTLGQEIKIP